MLNDYAEFDAKPELEIYADDVKCSHGSTLGSIDLNSIHYLKSRGIPEKEAYQMLINGFLSEILEKCGLDKTNYTLKISSRKFTDKLFQQLKIRSKSQISTTLRALDKIDRLGWGEAKKLLGEGRKDKSGDYTKGANLNNDQIKSIDEISDYLNSENKMREAILDGIDPKEAYLKYGKF